MIRCADCKWNYPDHYLNPMSISGIYTDPICGICALERMNAVYGVQRTEFNGKLAEAIRKDALAWRAAHPSEKSNE